MIKSILRRWLSITLAMVLMIGAIPATSITVHAASVSNFSVDGISASYDKGTWSATGNTITGSVKTNESSSCTGTTYTQVTGTLTITNTSGAAGVLSFGFSKTGGNGTAAVNDVNNNIPGSFILNADDSVIVTITSAQNQSDTTSVELSNISFAVSTNITTTFAVPENGTYTVDGEEITSEISKEKASTETYAVSATAASGYKFFGWYSQTKETYLSKEANTSLILSESQTIVPIFLGKDTPVFSVGGELFTDLNEASDYATANSQNMIVLVDNGILPAGDYIIPSGKTLLIPFDAEHTCYTDSPVVLYNSYATPTVYKKLSLAQGANITVESGGAISVSSQISSKGQMGGYNGTPTGPGGRIGMGDGSSIVLESGASLYAYGFISGSGSIEAESGSKVYECFQIKDWRGGSATSNIYGYAFPMSQYYVQNVEVPLTLDAGAMVQCVTAVNANSRAYAASVQFIGSNGMFKINGGAVTKRYDGSSDRLIIDVNGDCTLNRVSLSGLPIVGSVDSSDYSLPLNSNITIHVASGSQVTVSQDLKMLPGTELIIDAGAEVEIEDGTEVALYDSEEWVGKSFTGNKDLYVVGYSVANGTTEKRGAGSLTDARIDVNGTLKVNGNLYTTESGADITSSGKSGTIVFNKAVTNTSTMYEMANNSTKTAVGIVTAMLHNGVSDPAYTLTTDVAAGSEFYYDAAADMWKDKNGAVTVTFYPNIEENETEDKAVKQTLTKNTETALTPNTFVREGYSFTGWNTVKSPTETTPGVAYVPDANGVIKGTFSADTTLYAQWQIATYKVTFDKNAEDATGEMEEQEFTYDVEQALTANEFEREGYTFAGWNTEKTPTISVPGTVYTDGQAVKMTADTTLYAQWVPAEYTVTFDKNAEDATGEMEGLTVQHNVSVTLTANAFERTGYSFAGWNTVSAPTESEPGTAFEPDENGVIQGNFTEDTILYAQWKINTQTVTYNANAEDAEGSMEPQAVNYNTETELTENGFTRTGYKFTGWNTEQTPTEDTPGTAFTPDENGVIRGIFTADTILYAQWEPMTYTITFDGNGADEGTMDPVDVVFGEANVLPENTFSRTGYSFTGWMDQNGKTYTDGQEEVLVEEDLTLTAQWQIDSYTVKFEVDGGQLEQGYESQITVEYGTEITLPSATKPGSTAESWLIEDTDERYAFGAKYSVTGDVTFIPDWTAIEYTIKFIDHDGEVLQESTWNYGDTPAYAGDSDPSRADDDYYSYVFTGWAPEIAMVTGDATYTAQYSRTAITHTLHFDANAPEGTEASGTMDDLTINGVTATAVPENIFTVEGYTFTGWNTESDGSGDSYNTESEVISTSDVTLYAQWEINEYTITWQDDAGNTIGTTRVTHGETPSFTDPIKEATNQYSYTFKGWSPTPTAATGDATYKAEFTETVRTYTVTWKNGDEVLKTNTVAYGTTPVYDGETPVKEATSQYNYSFKGWSPAVTEVTGDATYTATFDETLRSYTVTWKDENGEELEIDENVLYGATPVYDGETPSKEATAQYTYTFKGWKFNDEEEVQTTLSPVSGDTIYTAAYEETVNKYAITFKDEDGSVLKTEDVAYGELPEYDTSTLQKEATAEYTYSFDHWEPEISDVTGTAEYTAVYSQTKNKYTVTWKNDNGDTLGSDEVEYGVVPSYNETPSKDSTAEFDYEFEDWSPALTEVTGDVTYTATYKAIKRRYTISFYNEDGTNLYSADFEYGTVPVYGGETPTKEGNAEISYTFAGWDPVIREVTGEAEYKATFTEVTNSYTVKWVDYDGSELETDENVLYGTTPSYDGDEPSRESTAQYNYEFDGWTPEVNDVTGNITYTATYKETTRSYTVRFMSEDGAEVLYSAEFEYGTLPSYEGDDPVKEEDNQYTYNFIGWNPAVTEVTSNADYYADFTGTVKTYTIKWLDEDGNTTLETDYNVPYGDEPAFNGSEPHKESDAEYDYVFSGWEPEPKAVTGDAQYKAVYDKTVRKYTVTWVNDEFDENGENIVLETDELVPYGDKPVYDGQTPAKTSDAQFDYTFTNWAVLDNEQVKLTDETTVEGNVTFVAEYSTSLRSYTVKWVNEDGTELEKDENVTYGSTPVYNGETPVKAADNEHVYTFKGWSPAPAEVTGDVTYTASYEEEARLYDITWKNADGTILTTTKVGYDQMPEAPENDPSMTSDLGTYTFVGWTPEIVKVTGNAEYTAEYSYTGWQVDETGRQYVIENEIQKTDWTVIDGHTYYLDTETGYAATDVADLPESEDKEAGKYVFSDTGIFLENLTGVYTSVKSGDIYYVENGKVVLNKGLYRVPETEEYYYFGEDGTAFKDGVTWVGNNNDLLPKWDYDFGPDGIIKHEDVTMDGVLEVDGVKYYYIDGIRVHYGMFFMNGYYYYADRTGKLITDRSYWCSRNNGLMEEGAYTFDEEGRMILPNENKNGIYEEDGSLFYYVDGERTYAGLIEIDGDYYYVRTGGEVVHNRSYWITKTNDLMKQGAYEFAEDGKMIIEEPTEPKNGIYEEDGSFYYYVNDVRTYAGLIEIDGAYYYVKTSGEVVHSRSYWITKTNDLMPEAAYDFDDEGKMIIKELEELKNGIVAEDGTLFYYVDNVKTYVGLIEIDGDYYYVRTSGELVHGRSYWITKTNGLVKEGAYEFDDSGRMIP